MHISEGSVDILDALVFLDVLAEGAVPALHVGKFILILNEELAAVVAHVDGNVRHDVLEVALGVVLIEVAVIQNVDFLVSERLKHKFIHFDWFVVLASLGVHQVEQSKRESIVVHISMLGEGHDLLLVLVPLADSLLLALVLGLLLLLVGVGRVLLQEFDDTLGVQLLVGDELNQRQGVKAAEVVNWGQADVLSCVTSNRSEWAHVHAETFAVTVGLASDLECVDLDLLSPLVRDFEGLQLLESVPRSLVCFKLVTKLGQGKVNEDKVDAGGNLGLQVVGEEAGRVES